jgi:hypothetical protein
LTLVSEIISDAYRESNLIATGASPTSAEQTEALRLLNRIISSFYGTEAGEELRPFAIGDNNITRPSDYPYDDYINDSQWVVPANTRLMLNLTSALTVYLHPEPEDGARFAFIDKSGNLATHNLTIVGNGKTIASANSVTVSTNSANQEYFYRADTGDWALVSPLEADDTFPFPDEFEDLFVIELAARINPRNGVVLDAQSGSFHSRLMGKFKTRYRQTKPVSSELGLRKLSSSKRTAFDTRRSNADFTVGHPR